MNLFSYQSRCKHFLVQKTAAAQPNVAASSKRPNDVDASDSSPAAAKRLKQSPIKKSPPVAQKTVASVAPASMPAPRRNPRIVRQQIRPAPKLVKQEETFVMSVDTAAADIDSDPKLIPRKTIGGGGGGGIKILNKNAPPPARAAVVADEVDDEDDDDEDYVDERPAKPVKTEVYPCTECERSFPLRQLLEIHMNNHTRERSFECNICTKRFFSKYDLAKHMLIHTGDKPFVCVICSKAFSRSTLLTRHERIHSDQPKLFCTFCDRSFLSEPELKKHTERHNKTRPFSCQMCDKSFAFKQGLERHEVIHAKVQPYECEHCSISFATPSKLARHLTSHAGRRPYPCRLCHKSYLMSHHLTRHIRSHKLGNVNFTCADCDATFTKRDDLVYHSAIHATENCLCPLCKEKFNSIEDVTEHIKLHTKGEQFACEFCDLIFTTEDKLIDHSVIDHVEENEEYIDDERVRADAAAATIQISKVEDGDQGLDDGEEIIEEYIIDSIAPESSPRILNFISTNDNDVVADNKDGDDDEANVANEVIPIEFVEYDSDDEGEVEEEEAEEEKVIVLPSPPPPRKKAPLPAAPPKQFGPSKGVVTKKPMPASPPKQIPIAQQKLEQSLQAMMRSRSKDDINNSSIGDKRQIDKKSSPVAKEAPILKKVDVKNLPVGLSIRKTTVVAGSAKIADAKPMATASTKRTAAAPAGSKPTIVTPPPSRSSAVKKPSTSSPSEGGGGRKITMDKSSPRNEDADAGEGTKLQTVRMTKSQVAAMAKEGKIEIKGGRVFYKQKSTVVNNRK